MLDRSTLGAADVTDEKLATMVAAVLGHDTVELIDCTVEPVDYDVASLTTIGRHWVSGAALTPAGTQPYRLFVKQVQAWHHSPAFQAIPPEVRERAAAQYPWRIEAAVYRSDLAGRLPDGLSMPRCLTAFDVDPDSVVLWIEAVPNPPTPWDAARYGRAAYLLGRLSASAKVRELDDVGRFDWSVMDYVHGRLLGGVVPAVMSDPPWRAPAVAAAFGPDLRDRLRAACAQVEQLGLELLAMPHLASHGDASPNNLLAGCDPDEIILIDFGLWRGKPVGFDLGQLVGGEAQLGRLPDVPLTELDELCVGEYTRGLADEGVRLEAETVRRAHALQLFLFSGASTLPDDEQSAAHCDARARLARHSLDLLDRTGR